MGFQGVRGPLASGYARAVFPATSWTLIRRAGESDRDALERFARSYERPVRAYVAKRGFAGADADDVCQDVFVRLLQGRSLERAESARGRFRSFLLAIVVHVIQDRLRRRRPDDAQASPAAPEPAAPPGPDPDFDREWALELFTRAFERLRETQPAQYDVLRAHLAGEPQDRQKLWIARGRFAARLRHEIALTCSSAADLAEEIAHFGPLLARGGEKGGEISRDALPDEANREGESR